MPRGYTNLAWAAEHAPWPAKRVLHVLRALIREHFSAGVLPPSEAYEWLLAVADLSGWETEGVVRLAWEASLVAEWPRPVSREDVRGLMGGSVVYAGGLPGVEVVG
jgi:hypothetical protein